MISPKVQGKGVPRPVTSFDEAGFPEYILASIRAQGFASPTPIQCQAWPMALSGRDVVAIAQTGSGKTISFALPAMLHINAYVCICSSDLSTHQELVNLYLRQAMVRLHLSLHPHVSLLYKYSRSAQSLGMFASTYTLTFAHESNLARALASV